MFCLGLEVDPIVCNYLKKPITRRNLSMALCKMDQIVTDVEGFICDINPLFYYMLQFYSMRPKRNGKNK